MNAGSTAGIVGLIALIVVNAVVSAAHAALVNARKQQLKDLADLGDRRAQRALDICEDATRLLTSRQFVGIILRFLAAGLLTVTVAQPLVPQLVAVGVNYDIARLIVYPLVWIVGAVVMLVFGELIPAAFASTRPERLAMVIVGPMTLLLNVLSPITRSLLWFSNRVASIFGGRNTTPYVTEEEIKTLVDAGSEEGVIEDEEKEMIYSIFQFGDKVAREVMVPRIDMVALDADSALQQALDLVLDEGHSRIPVYDGSIDRIIGLLYAKDLLVVWRDNQSKERKVREIMRPAYFVPESKKAGSLLEELQQRKIHMAIVIDEYGGTAGLVTIEDLVEEIVGEIQDEYDPDEEAEFEKIGDDEYLFDASIHLDDVNKLLDVHLPDEESDTLGGFVLTTLGRVPLGGEVFQAKDLEIKVESMTGRRIRKVRVRRLPPAPPAEESEERKPEEPVPDNTRTLKQDTL
jgi:putative hemolysin